MQETTLSRPANVRTLAANARLATRGAGVALVAILGLGLGAATGAMPPETVTDPVGSPVDSLGWLAGCWEGTLSNGATYEEVWLSPRGGMLIGMARMTRDDRALSFEFLRIAEEGGAIVYNAQPSGRPPTPFRATATTAGEATFENPDHDFPQRILYRLASEDELLARIEGEREGQLRGLDFPLRRVPCPGPGPV